MQQEAILIIEDERLVALNLAAILEQAGYGNSFITDNRAEAKIYYKNHTVQLIISDISLFGKKEGPEIIKDLLELKSAPVIYLTAFSDAQIVENALATHPAAYVLKPFTERQLLVAVKMALQQFCEKGVNEDHQKPSTREIEIIKHLTNGHSSKKIAESLFISEHTVKTHRRNLLKRYSVESSSGLIALAMKQKWIRL